MLGVNSAGLKSKFTSFKKVIQQLKPAVFFTQETKYKEEGQLKLGDEYVIYEQVRKNEKGGGGLALGCLKELNPCWISEGSEYVEAISISICIKNMKIRCCTAYGPQENDSIEKKEAFWDHLDKEVFEAETTGEGFILQFDGNLWAGDRIVPGDPRSQNKNGKLFEQFLKRNPKLTVVNSLPICEGLVTRSRNKDGLIEESVLDFFIVCSSVLPFVSRMIIDESRNYPLTNYKAAKKDGRAIDSDHFTEYIDLDMEITKERPERQEILNFKDKKSQELFKDITSKTEQFTDCFDGEGSLIEKIEKWRKLLFYYCSTAFKKIRIRNKKMKPINKKISNLIDKRNKIVTVGCFCGKRFGREENLNTHSKKHEGKNFICAECDKTFRTKKVFTNHLRLHKRTQIIECKFCGDKKAAIDIAIAEEEASENRDLIMKQFKFLSENPENIVMQKMWKVLKTICPKQKPNLPTAKKNFKGKIVSSKKDIKNLLANEFKNRLRSRPYREDLNLTKIRRKIIFDLKYELSQNNKSQLWTIKDLEKALKDLKRNKSRDSEGLVNEIFKNDVIGSNLKESLLIMFNSLKKENMIAEFMNHANISTVPKKGPAIDLKNQRGIFRVSVIRSILMRLIYNSKYEIIDANISDGQMGARKGKGCKMNIWIINGIIHEVLKNKKKNPIMLQIYDYAQMFDSINLKEAVSDIYDYGLDDDDLTLIYKANEQVHMAVKTHGGLTKRQTINNSVLQGDTFGSLLASVQADTIAKDVEMADIGFKYKEELPISILGLVDDLIGVSEVGFKAQLMNNILNLKSAEKTLQFGKSKCKIMMIGKGQEYFRSNPIYVDSWSEKYIENKLTGETELVEKFEGKIKVEEVQQQKYLGFVLSSTGNNLVNIKAMEKKSIGVIRTIINKLEKLNLRQYFFECSKIFMNVILRGSILYAAECYYNLTESNLRRIERIEEKYMRIILKTSKSCPIAQMYLELGQWPARFEIKKMRCLFLRKILKEDEQSQIFKFFKLQLTNPVKGDWVSTVLRDLTELDIFESLEEIRKMTRNKFKNMVKSRIEKKALEYLLSKRGSKGLEIRYRTLEISEYLLPFNNKLNIEEKRKLFETRNRMTRIPYNFGKKDEQCFCGKIESISHIYECKSVNQLEPKIPYNEIYNGNLNNQLEIFRRLEISLENRTKMKTNISPCDPCDPLDCVQSRFG